MTKNLLTIVILLLTTYSYGQEEIEKVYQTFKDTRVINAHSTEMLKAGYMDFRIGHRFGDFAGPGGGWETFGGLENATDVMIGFEFGLTDNMMIGINRAKGSGPLRQNVNGIAKIRLAEQDVNGSLPFSIAVLGQSSISTMPKSLVEGQINFFAKFAHRMTHHAEIITSRKFSNYFSLQLSGAWTYRNIVPSLDKNDIVSVGIASRIQLTKSIGLILDGRIVFSELRTTEAGYYPPLGFGIEWETGGGHVFQMNFTNATGISQTDYIPYTQSNWLDGGYRLGFTIGRQFKI
ncbi:MAG: hypothetical protein ACJA1A_001170 [Saprospiraceae bacterium]|jgi:hypothetical protein|tara:strand:- start:834 stop:1706 length:873 start_codon:yes stop_codon:yes gene_type:complete